MVPASSESQKLASDIQIGHHPSSSFDDRGSFGEHEMVRESLPSFISSLLSQSQVPLYIFLLLWCGSLYFQSLTENASENVSELSSLFLFSSLYFFFRELFLNERSVSYVKLFGLFCTSLIVLFMWSTPLIGAMASFALLLSTAWHAYGVCDIDHKAAAQADKPISVQESRNCKVSESKTPENVQSSVEPSSFLKQISQIEKERDELKSSLFTTRQELAKAYVRVRELESREEELFSSSSDGAEALSSIHEDEHQADCLKNTLDDTDEEISKDAHRFRARYDQLKEQFQEQRQVLDDTRKELFIVQGRELALSHKLQEYDIVASYTSLNEIAQALSSAQKLEGYDEAQERLYLQSVVDSYEHIIEKLLQENEGLKARIVKA